MKKHERILERRKIFKQELLRPLAALMYYEINVKKWRFKQKQPEAMGESRLLSNLTQQADAFHEFLQSHEFAHHERLSDELLEKLAELTALVGSLRKFYELQREKPPLFDVLPRAVNQMRKEIRILDAFEKRNEKYSE